MSSDLGFILITTVTAFLSYSTNALLHSGSASHGVSPRDYYLTTDAHWFNQTLDHYSPHDHRKFRQRYYEYLDNFRAPDGPVFMIICGEGPCSGIAKDYMSVLAKKFEAGVVSLEHRYYGKSYPFNSLATENLRYLSSKQALFDLAAFRQHYQARMQEALNVKLNRSSDNPWFFFGVSYPGALSAWFRLKFPHLTCGSLASSAVVHAVYDFSAFDQQIAESAGQECKDALQETNKLLEIGLKVNRKAVKALFNATELHVDADFLYLTADAAVMAFQYGNSDKLCVPLVEAKENGGDLVETYSKYVRDHCMKVWGLHVRPYNRKHLRNTVITAESTYRIWWFQVCTELAYFQVAPANNSVRSQQINTEYHLDLCKSLFGKGTYPDVDATNMYYGGHKIAATKIIFTNGSQDPWRHASKQTSSPELPSYIMDCHNCGHGTDLRGCPQSPMVIEGKSNNCSSPDVVNKVRQQMVEHIDLWLSECRGSTRSSK
ncbi:probable serine protease EDA2 [Brassica rapa]|uniref:probable serine protease EDA2 n=1 Tax=Brassica campestris TaxID=3711 RepID=UPI00142E2E08|nr:probable serine protease EDA2 [Brassica rapa]